MLEAAHVLIIDDNPIDLEFLKLILKEQGITSDAIDDPLDALAIFDPDLHDLVLLDINMPEMDGFEVANQLKDKVDSSMVPIIFISALDQEDYIQKAFSIGGQDYIQKPIIPNEVIARVKMLTLQSKSYKKLKAENFKKEQTIHLQQSEIRDLKDSSQMLINTKKLHEEVILMLHTDILPRLNILKHQKVPWNRRKIILDEIEKDLIDTSSVFSKKDKLYQLTPSEMRVFLLLQAGMSSKEIADALNLSIQTISTHRKHIRKKMGLKKK